MTIPLHHTRVSNLPHCSVRNYCLCQFLFLRFGFCQLPNKKVQQNYVEVSNMAFTSQQCVFHEFNLQQNLFSSAGEVIQRRAVFFVFIPTFCPCCVWRGAGEQIRVVQKSMSILVGNQARRENGGFWRAKQNYKIKIQKTTNTNANI